MKYFFILLLFPISLYAQTTSELVVLKHQNYKKVSLMYHQLKSTLELGDEAQFCDLAESKVEILYEIYNEDMLLYQSLKQYGTEDFDSYATHLNENSASDLFMFSYFENLCMKSEAYKALKSFSNIEKNLNYLKLTHKLWMSAYCPVIEGECYHEY